MQYNVLFHIGLLCFMDLLSTKEITFKILLNTFRDEASYFDRINMTKK